MEVFSHNIRHHPRFVLHCLNRVPHIRFYTKETLNRRRNKAPARSLRPPPVTAHIPKRNLLPPLPKPTAFGKPRDPSSNAAKAERFKESRRIEKALRHENHGENIYAYKHLQTGQVVYSLTRVMDNNQILRQLVFHGKKTVPASLRRDLWTPYFSLHFPSSYSGLLAYHQLRELSLQRQLKPPDYLIRTSIQSADKKLRARMSKAEEEKWDEEREGKEHPDGITFLVRKEDRAKTLMMQKATSVADVAFVVDLLHRKGHLLSQAAVEEMLKTRRVEQLQKASKRGTKMLRAQWRDEEASEQRYKDMTKRAQEGTKWGLERYAAKRIATEHGGAVVDPFLGRARVILPGREGNAQKEDGNDADAPQDPPPEAQVANTTTPSPSIDPLVPSLSTTPNQILILWSDLRDAAYAAKWPEHVSHGELARVAVSRRVDGKGETHFTDRSVHVMGGMKMSDEMWMRGAVIVREEGGSQGVEGGGGDDGGLSEEDGVRGKSREEQREELDREGVVVDPSPRRTGLVGWVKGRLGIAA